MNKDISNRELTVIGMVLLWIISFTIAVGAARHQLSQNLETSTETPTFVEGGKE